MTGDEFREARLRAGLSYRQAAERLGVALSTIQQWEEADIVPDAATAIVAIDDQDQIAYTLGRLVAVLERCAGEPFPATRLRSIRMRPLSGLGQMMTNYHRLPFARRDDELVGELMRALPPHLPNILPDITDANYQLGYEHERAAQAV